MDNSLVSYIVASLATVLTFLGVWYLLQVIAMWKIFTKAGEAGWKSIIPFYNEFTLFKLSWKNTMMAWIYLATSILGSVLMGLGGQSGAADGSSSPLYTIGCLVALVAVILAIVRNFKEAKAFGHGTGFGFGLWFLTPIFNLILGFSSDEYKGAQD